MGNGLIHPKKVTAESSFAMHPWPTRDRISHQEDKSQDPSSHMAQTRNWVQLSVRDTSKNRVKSKYPVSRACNMSYALVQRNKTAKIWLTSSLEEAYSCDSGYTDTFHHSFSLDITTAMNWTTTILMALQEESIAVWISKVTCWLPTLHT